MMIWIVGGCVGLGISLVGVGCSLANSANSDNRSAGPIYVLPGLALIVLAVLLAIGNAAVKALL